MSDRNLATDADAIAAYDEPGSWGRLSEGWPSTPYTIGKMLLCTKAEVVPYGQYVVIHADNKYPSYDGAVIRVANEALKAKLEKAYEGMFVECKRYIAAEVAGKVDV
jgi:hypothetical protein